MKILKVETSVNIREPIFKSLLRRKTMLQEIGFSEYVSKVKKFIVDKSEFVDFTYSYMRFKDNKEKENNTEEEDFFNNKILCDWKSLEYPYSNFWIEFFNINEFKQNPLPFDVNNMNIATQAVGIDLIENKIYIVFCEFRPTGSDFKIMRYDFLVDGRVPFRKDIFGVAGIAFKQAILIAVSAAKYLQSEIMGMEYKNIQIGVKKKRSKIKPIYCQYQVVYRKKKIVHYINPENESLQEVDIQKEKVDWDHRWDVQGHWRSIRGLGRGADGEPVIGKTWVRDHIKGPEDKPLIERTRIVLNSTGLA